MTMEFIVYNDRSTMKRPTRNRKSKYYSLHKRIDEAKKDTDYLVVKDNDTSPKNIVAAAYSYADTYGKPNGWCVSCSILEDGSIQIAKNTYKK